MPEKLIIMSLSLPPDMRDIVKDIAKTKQVSASKVIRTLVEQYLPIVSDVDLQATLEAVAKKKNITVQELVHSLITKHLPNPQEFPIILKVPVQLKGNEVELKNWLDQRVSGIIKALK